VKCGPHPVCYPDWTDPCLCTDGACWVAWRELSDRERLDHLFGLFGSLSVADKVPAEEVHSAFCELDEPPRRGAAVQRPSGIGATRLAVADRDHLGSLGRDNHREGG
jgi:hypothetical protein